MKISDIITSIPKAIISYLKALTASISENLNNGASLNNFDGTYERITKCKDCDARRDDVCRVCGCNVFVKCEIRGLCPIWNAHAVSKVCAPLRKYEVGDVILYSRDSAKLVEIVPTEYNITGNPYIVYEIDGKIHAMNVLY